MSTLEEQIDIGVPAEVAWECLHRVESYPSFVAGVREAHPKGNRGAHLDLDAPGEVKDCDAEITDRAQGTLMMWHTARGADLRGAFSVRPVDEKHTQVQVRVEYDPAKVRETFGGPKGFAQSDAIQRVVRHDLERFKDLVERQH
jgi:uncharacterized membrane protein